jgi:hypothetical protein
MQTARLGHRGGDDVDGSRIGYPENSHLSSTHRYQFCCELSCPTGEVRNCGGCVVAAWLYAYNRQRSTRMLASFSGSLTISMWQVSISMSVCTPPSASMHSC